MIDTKSLADVLFYDAFKRMGFTKSLLKQERTPLIGFAGETTYSLGSIELAKKKKRVVLGELLNLCKKKSNSNVPKESKSDIDTRSDDPQMCAPYVTGIFVYLRQLEVKEKSRPLIDYIDKVQKDVTPNMRGVLVDWQKLQLLGVSSMLIASKYEEILPPNVEDFCYITDNTYTKQEIVKMAADILLALQFELGNPTTNIYLRRFTKVAQEDFNVKEVMGEIEKAGNQYSKAVRLMVFLLVEAPMLILNPPLSLTNSDRYRLRKYIDILSRRLKHLQSHRRSSGSHMQGSSSSAMMNKQS
ncbi:hypothetical protein Bca101_049782 [Brassica carinata]